MPYTPARAYQGLNTASGKTDLFGDFPWPDPISCCMYSNDFFTYAAADWTVSTTNSGTSALTNGNGGNLLLTTGATSGNYQANYLTTTNFAITPGYRTWFWINVSLSDVATHNLFTAGLVDTLSTMTAPGYGVYFNKADASSTVSLLLNNNGTITTLAVGTMVISTATTLGFYYDGAAIPTIWAYSSIGMTVPAAFGGQPNGGPPVYGGRRNIAAGVNSAAGTALTNLPPKTTGLTLGYGIKTGANVAKTATIDYVGAAMQVARF